jgi:hypothetical protein
MTRKEKMHNDIIMNSTAASATVSTSWGIQSRQQERRDKRQEGLRLPRVCFRSNQGYITVDTGEKGDREDSEEQRIKTRKQYAPFQI